MKKEILFSAVLLSQPLIPFASQAFAANANSVGLAAYEPDSASLLSKTKVMYRGVAYQVEVELNAVPLQQDGKIFDFSGTIFLRGKNGKNLQIAAGYDSDGNMTFEKISEDESSVTYRGYSCSSTLTQCMPETEGDVLLKYNRRNSSYTLSLDIRREIPGWDRGDYFDANTPLKVDGLELQNK